MQEILRFMKIPGNSLYFLWHITALLYCFFISLPDTLGQDERPGGSSLIYINTSFPNASPLYWEDLGKDTFLLNLVYEHERNSPNRANGHWFFRVEAQPNAKLCLILNNFDNFWNGRRSFPISPRTPTYLSEDGLHWEAVPAELTADNQLRFSLSFKDHPIYVASVEPYRISQLEKLLQDIAGHPLVRIDTIGATVEGRPLEIVTLGEPSAPRSVFIRARAHGFEAGGNWVVEGLIRAFLRPEAAPFLEKYRLYILPMANKDAVARGRTRFNSAGVDLNRGWGAPADPAVAPENAALETWLAQRIRAGKQPDLAIDLHNDRGGKLHLSHPGEDHPDYLPEMNRLEEMLRKHTWFTEGTQGGSGFHNPGTFGEGLLLRYGIHALVYELNKERIAKFDRPPYGADWELLGQQLLTVFYHYFE